MFQHRQGQALDVVRRNEITPVNGSIGTGSQYQ